MRPWKIEKGTTPTRVIFDGDVNEETDFPALLSEIKGPVVLDLERVKRINSVGVHGWIRFLADLERHGSTVVLERCSVPIVMQLNMISEFRGSGQVQSVQAPYFCGSCNEEHFRLIELQSGAPEIPDSIQCPKCGATLYFDDDPKTFLSFRRSA